MISGTLWQQAVALYRGGRKEEALATCRQLLLLQPAQAEVLALAGTIELERGAPGEAAAYFTRAIAAKKDFTEAHYNLGNALLAMDRKEEAVESYRKAVKLRPDLVVIHNNLGKAYQELKRWEEAAKAYRRAAALDPGNAVIERNLGIVLEAQGHHAAALIAYRKAVALNPSWSLAYSNLANGLLENGHAEEVVTVCDQWLAACPGTIEAIGLKSVALDELGRREEARHLVDLDRFVRVIACDADAGFNAALVDEVLAHPTLKVPDTSDPRYHGPHLLVSSQLFAGTEGALARLEAIVDTEIKAYLASVAVGDPHHPYLVKPPKRWRLIAWAAVLDRQGNLWPHIHYDGYVSGVYYPKIPRMEGAHDAGWFELGRPPDRFRYAKAPEVRVIEPVEGRMILFPSYFYHRTVPFAADERRISIAFDAKPVE
ncbi:MAG TPA: tetratricopeptide repeat protein [Stellaceae bacterium]|nr:tetratricopeptide repeat protein [Stellaceae bacterium]